MKIVFSVFFEKCLLFFNTYFPSMECKLNPIPFPHHQRVCAPILTRDNVAFFQNIFWSKHVNTNKFPDLEIWSKLNWFHLNVTETSECITRSRFQTVWDYQKVIITVIIVGVLNLKMVQANCVDSVDTQIKRHCPELGAVQSDEKVHMYTNRYPPWYLIISETFWIEISPCPVLGQTPGVRGQISNRTA